jgi:hypothetical protein
MFVVRRFWYMAPADDAGGAGGGAGAAGATGAASETTGGAGGASGAGAADDKGVFQMPASAISDIRARAGAKGRREAQAALDAQAKELGFESTADMFAKARAGKATNAAGAGSAGAAGNTGAAGQAGAQPTTPTAAPAEVAKAQRLLVAAQDASTKERTLRLQAERNLSVERATFTVREHAYRAGVKDVDVATAVLHRELQGKSAEELTKYDFKAYFEKQKTERPYLFGDVKPTPANTGATGADGQQPPVPGAAGATSQAVDANKFDARGKSSKEVDDQLRKMGISV